MNKSDVTVLRPCPFRAGQKIRIEGGPRAGDWEVLGADDKNVRLRCPISGQEVEWARFCYLVEERPGEPWPRSG